MGGSVRVIVRKESGEVIPMIRWTIQLPYIVKNPKFTNSDKDWLDKYIKSAENDTYNQCEQHLAPEGYGLVVMDFMKKKIYSSQGYTSLLGYSDVALEMDRRLLERKRSGKNKDSNDALDWMDDDKVTQEDLDWNSYDLDWNSYESARLFMEDGNLRIREFIYDEDNIDAPSIETEKFESTLDNAINTSRNKYESFMLESIKKKLFGSKDINAYYRFDIEYEKMGWQCMDFDDTPKGLFETFTNMYEDGFEFSEEDLTYWEKEFEEQRINMEEDGEEFPFKRGVFKKLIRTDKINDVLESDSNG